MRRKSFFIDTTLCTACRGCQIACKQWNQNPATKTRQRGTYQNPPDLSAATWKLVRFNEVESKRGEPKWNFFPDQCRHCLYPPCKIAADERKGGAVIIDSLTRAVIQAPGVFTTLRAARFEQAARDSQAVRDLIARYIELRWAESQQLSGCNAVHSASARLSRWLLQSADRIGSDHLPLTQEFLAQMLGVRRTTVTLLAQSMQERGHIKYTRGRIILLDRAAIEAASCECYHAVQQDRLPSILGFNL